MSCIRRRCLCVLRDWQSTHTHMRYLKVSQQQHSLFAVTHSPCSTSFPSLVDSWGAEKPVVYVHFISLQQSSEGKPGPLSQQRTTHHFPLSSLLLGLITESKHSGSMILVSQGRLLIQFSPQHCTVARSFSGESKGKEKKKGEIRVCVNLVSVLRSVSWKQGDSISNIVTDDLFKRNWMFFPPELTLKLISDDFTFLLLWSPSFQWHAGSAARSVQMLK